MKIFLTLWTYWKVLGIPHGCLDHTLIISDLCIFNFFFFKPTPVRLSIWPCHLMLLLSRSSVTSPLLNSVVGSQPSPHFSGPFRTLWHKWFIIHSSLKYFIHLAYRVPDSLPLMLIPHHLDLLMLGVPHGPVFKLLFYLHYSFVVDIIQTRVFKYHLCIYILKHMFPALTSFLNSRSAFQLSFDISSLVSNSILYLMCTKLSSWTSPANLLLP